MIHKYLLLGLFSIPIFFVAGTVAKNVSKKAEINQFPYEVTIMVHPSGHICNGGIIGDQFILTAAHCVVNTDDNLNAQNVIVGVETNDFNGKSKSSVFFEVKKIFVPKEFKPSVFEARGNIAVLKLKSPLKLSKNKKSLKTLKLPKKKDKSYSGKTVDVSGSKIQAVVLSNIQCQKDYPNFPISKRHICARIRQRQDSKDYGVCSRDSGGPLVHDKTIIGVLLAGPLDCKENVRAGIYTRVSYYRTFIENAMKGKKTKNIRIHELR